MTRRELKTIGLGWSFLIIIGALAVGIVIGGLLGIGGVK